MYTFLRIPVTLLLVLPLHAWAVSPADKLAEDMTAPLDRGVPVRVIVQIDAGDETVPVEDPVRRSHYNEVRARVLSELPVDGYDKARPFSHLPMMSVRIKNRNALDKLLEHSDVVTVFPDKPHKAMLAQSLPLIGQTPVANVMARAGANTTVAVLDTGGMYTRPEFGSCTAVGAPSTCKVVAAQDFAYPDDILDDNGSGLEGIGHGTEVAATVAGVAPSTKFALLDVFDGEDAWSVDIIDAINWSIANKDAYAIAAINMSLGDGTLNTATCSKSSGVGANPFVTPIRTARNAGIVVVIASGNEGYSNGLASPACVPESLSVGSVYDATIGGVAWGVCTDATTAADKVACYSNSANFLDLLAPGSAITVAGNTVHGTSLAAPMAAGAVAVLKGAYPSETPAQIEARITSAGVPVTDARNALAKPRLNLLAAQGAPVNDGFSSAIALSGNQAAVSGWNFNATSESGEPLHAGQAGGRSIWWTWVAPGNGTLSLDTQNSGVDTLLAVYTGTTVGALVQVAANDNGAGGSGGSSAASMNVSAGTTYHIAVDGKSGVAGSVALQLTFAQTVPSADLALTISGPASAVEAGQQTSYSVTVTNAGPDIAQNAMVSLNYPSGWTLAGGSCVGIAAQTAQCNLGNIPAGQAAMTMQAFNTGSQAGTFQMIATVASDTADPLQANNADTTDTMLTQPSATSVNEGDVPTLTEWAAILMAAMLFGISARRRMAI
jgi:uncharacterized repeat protein (TIGR01451 family)